MHVVFGDVGDFVVHDVRQLIDVDAACSDVGGHQCAQFAGLEAGQCLGACALALVAVQRHGADVVLGQEFGNVVGAELGAREHQNLAPVVLVDDVQQHLLFLAAAHGVDHLGDALHGGVAGRDLDGLRIAQQAVGQVADLVAEGGREQQALLFLGHQGQHLLDVVDEAHVQHAVGFVEHQDFDGGQVHEALLLQIQQAARRGDQDVHALLDAVDLGLHAHAAEDDGGVDVQVLRVAAHRFLDLRCEFTRGRQHQGADALAAELVARHLALREAVQHGQGEGRGLAGAGLGACQQVVAGEHRRNGLCLDGSRVLVTLLKHGLQNGGSQIQFFKCHVIKDAPVRGAGYQPAEATRAVAGPVVGG